MLAAFVAGCGGANVTGNERVAAKDQITLNVALANERFTLDNGLEVVLHPERSARKVAIRIRYRVGSKDDPNGRSGMAHLFEHLMFNGARGEPDFNQRLEARGAASTNASTDHDETDYYEAVAPSQTSYALWLEAQRMAAPLRGVDETALAKERDVVKNEWREHYDNEPYGQVYVIAEQAAFGPSHPYGRSTIGLPSELDAVTMDDLFAFAATHYRPNNATLVVCGAFDPGAVKPLVVDLFGKIPPGAPRQPRTFPFRRLGDEKRISVVAGVEAPMVMAAWPAPPPDADGYHELVMALEGFEGQLWNHLVHDAKIADEVDVDIWSGHLGSLVTARVRLKKGEKPSGVSSAIDEAIRKSSNWGRLWDWPSFGDDKSKHMLRRVFALEDIDRRAQRILHDLEYHDVVDGMQAELKKIQAIRAADVGSALERFLGDQGRVLVVVSPDPNAPPAGRVE